MFNIRWHSKTVWATAIKCFNSGNFVSKNLLKTKTNRKKKKTLTSIYKVRISVDETRVKLTPIEGEEGSDFINASFIPVS